MTRKEAFEIEHIRASIEEMRANVAKMTAETQKVNNELRFPPIVQAAVLIGLLGPALAAVTTWFLRTVS